MLNRLVQLCAEGSVRASSHAVDEMALDRILIDDLISSITSAELVEDYPNAGRGPSALLLQTDHAGQPIHAVWGIPAGHTAPAVVITAYRPDPVRWDRTFTRRITKSADS